MNKQFATLARRAADLLERHGWIQRAYETPKGHCLVGAAYAVCQDLSQRDVALFLVTLADKLNPAFPASASSLFLWNDDEHRTGEQVIKELRAFAAEQESEEK